MPEIIVPTLNSLDDFYEVGEWKLEDGAGVEPGQVVVVIETTKASVEIEAEHGGSLRRLVPTGGTCAPGQAVAEIICADAERSAPEDQQAPAGTGGDLFITLPAQRAMERLGLTETEVARSAKRVVRHVDIEELAGTGPPARPAGPAAPVVGTSHAIGPVPCYMSAHVQVQQAQEVAKDLSRQHKALIGLPEMVLHHIGECLKEFPNMCPSQTKAEASIGVTMDLGKGLFVPVVHDVASQSLPALAKQLMAFRKAALASKFKPGDLGVPDIVLALNQFEGVDVVIPMIYPGNFACIALGPVQRTISWDDGPVAVEQASIGVAYDHRHLTGSYVAAFLASLRRGLESVAPGPASPAHDVADGGGGSDA